MDPAFLTALLLLACSAILSGAEASLFSLGARGGAVAVLPGSARALLHERASVLATILLANLMANLAFFAAVHSWSEGMGEGRAAAANLGALLLLIVFGEIMPKVLGNRLPLTVGRLFLPPVRGLHLLLGPPLRPIAASMVPRSPGAEPLAPEDAEALLRGEEAMDLAPEERALVRHVLELGKLRAGALRVPLARIVQVPADEPLGLARRRMERANTVYALVLDARGEVIGALDLTLNRAGARAADALVRVPILPEVAPATNGIGLLRDSGAPFLLLVDEYGQASGVVPRGRWADTLLDRLPRLGGSSVLRELGPGRFQADATLALHDFEDRFGAPGEIDVRIETLGGLLSDRLGRVAREGDHLVFDGPGFRGEIWVTRADETGPELLEIRVRPEEPDAAGGGT